MSCSLEPLLLSSLALFGARDPAAVPSLGGSSGPEWQKSPSRAGGDAVPKPVLGAAGGPSAEPKFASGGAAAARELSPRHLRSCPGRRGAAGVPGLRRCGAGAAPAPGVRRLTGGAAGAAPPPLAARAAEAAAAPSALAALPPWGSAAPGGCEWAPRGEARARAAAALGAPGPSAAPPPRKKCSSL